MKKSIFLLGFLFLIPQITNASINFEHRKTAEWENGYCYNFYLKNTETQAILNWKIKFDLPKNVNIYDKWNGNFSISNGNVEVTPLDWNNKLEVNGKTDVGICVTGAKDLPRNINFNYSFPNTNTYYTGTINNNNNNNTNTTTSDYFRINYPENKDTIFYVDRNGDGSYDEVMTLNPWNIASANGNGSLTFDRNNGSYYYEQNLSNIVQSDTSRWISGYPEVFVGRKPWGGQEAKGKINLPKKINEINSLEFTTRYEINNTSNGPLNFAAEGWLTTDPNRSTGVNSGEIEFMIMLYREQIGAAGSRIGEFSTTINVNGVARDETFEIYESKGDWDFYTFVPRTNYRNTNITLDLAKFIKEIKKYVSYNIDNYYLMNWEIGSEYGSPNINYSQFNWRLYDFSFRLNNETINNGTTNTGTVNNGNTFDWDEIINTIEGSDTTRVNLNKITYRTNSFNNLQTKFDNFLMSRIDTNNTSRYNDAIRNRNGIFESIKDYEDNKITKANLISKLRIFINNLKVSL